MSMEKNQKNKANVEGEEIDQALLNRCKNIFVVRKDYHQKTETHFPIKPEIDNLYKHDETRRFAMELIRNDLKIQEDQISYPFRPELNPNSVKITHNRQENLVDRVNEWKEQKNQKMKEKVDIKHRQTEEDLKKQTQKLSFLNSNYSTNSRVREFIDGMEYKKNSLVNSRVLYSSATYGRSSSAFKDKKTSNIVTNEQPPILEETTDAKNEPETKKGKELEVNQEFETDNKKSGKLQQSSQVKEYQNMKKAVLVKPAKMNKNVVKALISNI